jgi:hypothetical protein
LSVLGAEPCDRAACGSGNAGALCVVQLSDANALAELDDPRPGRCDRRVAAELELRPLAG